MKIGALRELLAGVPDDADIDFEDGNFGGTGRDLDAHDIIVSPDKAQVLISPPYWQPVD